MCKPQADYMHTCGADRKHSKLCFSGRAFPLQKIWGLIMDKLQERALSFRRLLDYEYKIILGRKNATTEITISFERSDFAHLIGLHKVKDVLNGDNVEKLFDKCLSGKITYDTITKSEFFSDLGNRFEYFNRLEEMLDSNDIIFKCNNKSMAAYSKITSDYGMKNILEELTFYLFIQKRSFSDKQFCKSFIHDEKTDYTFGQTKMTLIYKEKINKKTNERVIQCNKIK